LPLVTQLAGEPVFFAERSTARPTGAADRRD
jgi:hypothetical protein